MSVRDRKLYVFGFAEPGLPRTLTLLGRSLSVVSLADLDVVVERRRDAVEPTPDALQKQHAIVIRLVDRTPALLPARFGSVMDEAALHTLVSKRAPELAESLARVRGRRQMTIRVFGAVDRIQPIDDRTSTGTAFLQMRRARAHRVPVEVTAIHDRLASLVAAERVELGQRGLRATIYHLVSTRDIASYRKKAAGLDIPPHLVTVSGPWPAFAFAPELF